jgi:acetyltransferase-like isoleucine patch superfamily enzyme
VILGRINANSFECRRIKPRKELMRHMEWAIEAVLNKFLNERELVIWGTGPNSYQKSGIVSRYAPISFYISRDAEENPVFLNKPVYEKDNICGNGLDPSRHYVVVLADKHYTEIRDSLHHLGFTNYSDYYDWFPEIPGFPFGIEHRGVSVGKMTTGVGVALRFANSIGSFTSINYAALFGVNHIMNAITTKSLWFFLSEDQLDEFNSVAQSDIRHKPNPNDKITIGNDVWIGANAFINTSRCAVIGDGAIIGSNSLVLDDVPPYAIVYGSPAKVQRYRFTPEQIEILLRVKWWNWDNETISKNYKLLLYPELFFEKFG